ANFAAKKLVLRVTLPVLLIEQGAPCAASSSAAVPPGRSRMIHPSGQRISENSTSIGFSFTTRRYLQPVGCVPQITVCPPSLRHSPTASGRPSPFSFVILCSGGNSPLTRTQKLQPRAPLVRNVPVSLGFSVRNGQTSASE